MTLVLEGNPWDLSTPADDIVVPTTIGWTYDSWTLPGKGFARQCFNSYPHLGYWYADQCKQYKDDLPLLRKWPLIFIPIKPLNQEEPQLSWKNPSNFDMLLRGLDQLSKELPTNPDGKIYVPLLGAGSFEKFDVECLLHHHLQADHFIIAKHRSHKRSLQGNPGNWYITDIPWEDTWGTDG